MIYCIDTSALIDLDRLYPKEVFPSLWEKYLVEITREGRLISPHEVREELERKDDELWNWIKVNCKNLFIRDTQSVIDRVAELQTRFEGWINPEYPQKNMADPFVVALALEAHNIFPAVKEKETIVITHEVSTGNLAKLKLPDICRNLGLRPCRLIDLFKNEKWKIGG
jgi:hypothetical protein